MRLVLVVGVDVVKVLLLRALLVCGLLGCTEMLAGQGWLVLAQSHAGEERRHHQVRTLSEKLGPAPVAAPPSPPEQLGAEPVLLLSPSPNSDIVSLTCCDGTKTSRGKICRLD